MALMAKERRTGLQHALHHGSMRVMAVGAVFAYRLMVMDKRTPLFHVAGVARINHAIALHQLGADRAVGIMAIRACHLAFRNWMVRRLVDLRTLFLVAGKTHFRLCCLVTHFVVARMQAVAACAGDVTALVDAAFPMGTLGILLVARQACIIAFSNRRSGTLAKSTLGCRRLAGALMALVCGAFAVAASASGRASIRTYTVARLANCQ